MKISIVTVVYNGEAFLRDCIESVLQQDYPFIEYILIDGGSEDGTLAIAEQYKNHIHHFISEKDQGLYDALNKGIAMATGEVLGILNADDMLASPGVITAVAASFKKDTALAGLYGDLNYVHPQNGKVVRKWRSATVSRKDMEKGWMPAHPTLYLKRDLFGRYGNYALDMGTAADYDLILRYFYKYQIQTVYLPRLMVNMRTGGVSNASFKGRLQALKYDYKALKRNGVPGALRALFRKKFSKISQF